AKSYARIHWQNLVNFGVLPLEFVDESDYDGVEAGDVLAIDDLRASWASGDRLSVRNKTHDADIGVRHRLSPRQIDLIVAGGAIRWLKGEGAGGRLRS
ncbi:MAG: hypothetical protein ACRDPG_02220, partial [Nocardioidaceae bacterium]